MLFAAMLVASLALEPPPLDFPDSLVEGGAPWPTAAGRLIVPVEPSSAASGLLGPMAGDLWLTTPLAGDAESRSAEEAVELVEYSDAYLTRLTIHRWASYLTLPLFVSEYIVGQRLQNGHGSHDLLRLHRGLAAGIGGLFLVNTVTGGLNFLEGRKDPEGRGRRTLHSALMLLADAGFVATAVLGNTRRDSNGIFHGPTTSHVHRNVAIGSMATALVGYAVMLPPFRRE